VLILESKTLKKILSLGLVLVLAISVLVPVQVKAQESVNITVLETSDVHGHILAYDYGTDKGPTNYGLTRVSTYVSQVRKDNPNTILVDDGDFLQGTPMVEDYLTATVDPAAEVMNYLKYDAVVLGNHEFNFGMDVLNNFAKQLTVPLVSANVVKAGTTDPYFKPYVVVERNGVKIGILGLTTLVVKQVEKPANLQGVDLIDPVDTASKYVNILRNQEKVDVVILAGHSGLEYDPDTNTYSTREYPENFIYNVVTKVPGIDAVLSGHDHNQFAKTITTPFGTKVPVVQPNSWANAVGRIDITVTKASDGSWKVSQATGTTINMKDYAEDQNIVNMLAPQQQEVLSIIRTPIGQFTADFPALDPLSARVADNAYFDVQLKAMEWAAGTDIAIQAILPTNVPTFKQGPITVKDVNALYIYANTLYKAKVTGQMIKDLLEASAKYFVYSYDPLNGAKLTSDPNFRAYNYDAADGISYKIDVTRPVGDRVVDLTYKGEPLKMDEWYTIAINNYRFEGMRNTALKGAVKLWESDKPITDYIIDYIKEKKDIAPETDNNWSITPTYLLYNVPSVVNDYAALDQTKTLYSGYVSPTATLTRGTAACYFTPVYVTSTPTATLPPFKDLDPNANGCVKPLLQTGLYVGYGDNTVRLTNPLTREQAVVVALRGMKALDKLPNDQETASILAKYSDQDHVSAWARPYVAAALKFGWLKTFNGKIAPQDIITEGDLVYLLHWSRFPNVRMLSINDFHGNISTFYNDSSLKATVGGYETIGWYVNKYRSENPLYTYFFDAGDLMQGTPTSTVLHGEPLIALHNALGVDAMAVGNHEFDWGVDALKQNMSKANFPIISSNIFDKATEQPVDWVKPYTLVQKGFLTVGVVGYTTPETSITAHPAIVGGFDFKSASVVQPYVDDLKTKTNLVVVLAHDSAYQDSKTGSITGPSIDTLVSIKPDVLITGHSHTMVARIVNGVPIVQAWYNGRRIGGVGILYDALTGSKLMETATLIAPVVTAQTKVPEIASIIAEYDQKVGPVFGTEIGYTKNGLYRNYYGESNLGDFTSDIILQSASNAIGGQVDAAFQNAGGLRIDIPTGTITVGTIWALMPFDNVVVVMDLKGSDIKGLLERSCLTATESDANGVSKGQLQPSGIRWKCDMSKAIGSRVTNITFENGKQFSLDGVYKIATNDFLASGGDGFAQFKNGANITNTFVLVRDAIINGIKQMTAQGKTIDYEPVGRITIINP
jgi:2',3'-cyclic-nucleotide 2'-phosphodiesterase/3'-nucleotidase